MKTSNAPINSPRFHIDREPLRFRGQLPAISAPSPSPVRSHAVHDFLVPNPRPDLTAEVGVVWGGEAK
jgi:hypothetical protein